MVQNRFSFYGKKFKLGLKEPINLNVAFLKILVRYGAVTSAMLQLKKLK
jgi:hypothetical protein